MAPSLRSSLTSEQRSLLVQIRETAKRIWDTALHQYYTNHDVRHSERIIDYLDGLTAGVQTTNKALSPTEVFVLIAAAYLHDIGMQDQTFAGGDLDRIRDQHHEKSAEMIASSFEDPASSLFVPLVQDPAIVESIALVSRGHRKVDLVEGCYDAYRHGSETLRLRLLAALLRFGDELDIDFRRVDIARMQLLRIPVDSQLHWWRCHYVSGVEITDELVRISYRFPPNCDYEKLLAPQVENEIITKLNELKPIFRRNLLKIDIGPRLVRVVRNLKHLPPDVLSLLRKQTTDDESGGDAPGGLLPQDLSPTEMLTMLRRKMGDAYVEEMLGHSKEYEARRVREPLDPSEISQVGWGLVVPKSRYSDAVEALAPLLDHRRTQVGSPDLFRIMSYELGESKSQFLARHGVAPGPIDAGKCPYYLLVVGGPEEIPFRFQYELGVQYAVGRLIFDEVEDYRRYAEAVVSAETEKTGNVPGRVSFFGPQNRDDEPTRLSSEFLIKPLAAGASQSGTEWEINEITGEHATKERLLNLLVKRPSSSLIFLASHGISLPIDDPRQERWQGALVCQDWPGPRSSRRAPNSPEFFLSGEDLLSDQTLSSTIVFMFSCFSAGTPETDDFDHASPSRKRKLAGRSFVSHLPQRMLGSVSGPALAVVGRVDRAWTMSFQWPSEDGESVSQIEAFEKTVQSLLEGKSVGSSMQHFSRRAAEISVELGHLIEDRDKGDLRDETYLAFLQRAYKDARNWIVLGDPAVRLLRKESRDPDQDD